MVLPKKLINQEKHVTEAGEVYWILTFYMEESGEIKTSVVREDNMTFAHSAELPPYVQELEPDVQAKWYLIYKDTVEKEGQDVALLVANLWLERNIKSSTITARSDKVLESVKFEVDLSQPSLITRDADGNEFVTFKLADVFADKLGVELTPEVLKKWADKINNGANLVGDVDHEEYEALLQAGLSQDEIVRRLENKPGIAKTVQAIFDKGRLWVKALIDKRYKKQIEESKGVSMEAQVYRDNDGNIMDGDIFGWSFMINREPGVEGTEISF